MTRVPARFRPGEDPVAYVMARLGDVYPPVRGDWSDKTSDDALTHVCLYGIGAHRVERSGDFFVVRTNALAALPVREGLERYGGDCYFDVATWRVAKIVRREPAVLVALLSDRALHHECLDLAAMPLRFNPRQSIFQLRPGPLLASLSVPNAACGAPNAARSRAAVVTAIARL